MKALTATMLLTAALLAGCSGIEVRPSAITTDQMLCDQPRGGGVWVASAGTCIRGGGGM